MARKQFIKTLPNKEAYCFYSGIELYVPDKKQRKKHSKLGNFELTVEHLIPVSCHKNDQHLVPASKIINEIVGNAPLAVKFALKEHLQSVVFAPSLSKEQIEKIIVKMTKNFLEPYRASKTKYKSYVWHWKSIPFGNKLREEARQRYISLLTQEEYDLVIKYNSERVLNEGV